MSGIYRIKERKRGGKKRGKGSGDKTRGRLGLGFLIQYSQSSLSSMSSDICRDFTLKKFNSVAPRDHQVKATLTLDLSEIMFVIREEFQQTLLSESHDLMTI